MQQFLQQNGRVIRSIARDGNCFFRAISCHLLGNESEHIYARSLLLRFENLNESLFEKYLIPPFNKSTIEEHIHHLLRPGVWCTQVELLALATYYQVPLYCCITSDGTSYHWEVTNPIAPVSALRYPDITEEDPLHGIKPSSHFEFLYWDKLHFDVILCKEANLPSVSPPTIPVVHHFMSVD